MSMSTGQSGYASQPYGAPAHPAPPQVWPPQDPHVPPTFAHPSLGRRVGAYAIDVVILQLINLVTAVVVFMVVRADIMAALAGEQRFPIWTMPIFMIPGVVALAIALAYSAMQGSGGSVGQRMLGIRLVQADTGARLGFWRAVWRNIVWGATCAIIVGYFTPLFDSSARRRGWHDLASGAVMTLRGAADPDRPADPQGEYAAPAQPGAGPAPVEQSSGPAPAPVDPFAAPAPAASDPAPAPLDPFAAPPASDAVAPPVDPFAAPPAPAASEPAPAPVDPFEAPAAPLVPPAPAAAPVVPPMPAPPAPPVPEVAPDEPEASADGPIAFVPGVTGERDEQPEPVAPAAAPEIPAAPGPEPVAAPAPAPPVPEPEPAPAAPPVPSSAPETAPEPQVESAPAPAPATPDFPDDTIVLNHAPAPTNVPSVILVWDDGTRTEVTSRAVFGRNPSASDGADVVAVTDDTLSLSKTHFEISLENGSASIVDRHSTNGVVVVRGGTSTTLVPDTASSLVAGDKITIGERSASVERAGKS